MTNRHYSIIIIILFNTTLISSCKQFLQIDPPETSLVQETVFLSDEQATSAVLGMYSTMTSSNYYASGDLFSITSVAGVSSDELIGKYSASLTPFYENQLTPDISNSGGYSQLYNTIYAANSILEGLEKTSSVTSTTKAQLQGEALFCRAFAYFYLVNLYGKVPLALSTDYKINESLFRSTVSQVYNQILSDLKTAESLVPDIYVTPDKVRPNKSVVQCLLARTYLYLQDWVNAEKYSSLIIEKNNIYSLVDFNSVFLSNSTETVWQIIPPQGRNSSYGAFFILTATPTAVSLSPKLAENGFDVNDKRKSLWINSYTNTSGTYYYPYKYKIKSATTTLTEYYIVFRLAEQYLIRGEARINLGKIELGIGDVNIVRQRQIQNVNSNPVIAIPSNLNKPDALLATEEERKRELFSEWGHRWLDLKRTGRSTAVLTPLKAKWATTDELYPIPQAEISRNRNIDQNEGY